MEKKLKISSYENIWNLSQVKLFQETHSSYLYKALYKDSNKTILKLFKSDSDEINFPNSLQFFNQPKVAKIIKFSEEAALLEEIIPGDSLAAAKQKNYLDAAEIFCNLCKDLHLKDLNLNNYRSVKDLEKDFDLFLKKPDKPISSDMINKAKNLFIHLVQTQKNLKLLHGDLHHYNILKNKDGWVAIDPKGIVGELEYEVGAFLRNPIDTSNHFLDKRIFIQRVNYICSHLQLNSQRVMRWCFVQLVLAISYKIQNKEILRDWITLLEFTHSEIK
ncbi:MAG: aminoglycoside phosphotransferase family protein [Rickettsiales bacterium]